MKIIKTLIALLALGGIQASAQSTGFTTTMKVWLDEKIEIVADGSTVSRLTLYQYDEVNYVGCNMRIAVPEGLAINQVKEGRAYVNDIALSVRKNDHNIACNITAANFLKVLSSSPTNSEYYPDEVEGGPAYYPLWNIGLIADPSTYNGIYRLEMDDVIFTVVRDNEVLASFLDHMEYCEMTVTGGTDFPGVAYEIPESGYSTMIVPVDCEIPDGMTVYVCTAIDGDKITLERVESIEANTPYVVKGTTGTYELNGTYCGLKLSYSTEFMTGVYAETAVPAGAYIVAEDAEASFNKVSTEGEATVAPYHCYFNVGEFGDKLIVDNSTTGIDDLVIDGNLPVNVYNTLGQAVRINVAAKDALKDLLPGIYLINGNKYVVK